MPKSAFVNLLSILGLVAQLANGQLEPDCNPLHADCPAKKGWPEDTYYIDFTKETTAPENWIIADYEPINFTPRGAEFTYGKSRDAPNMWTDFYILGGRYDVEMQIAPGQGIISSSVLWSDTQDEIDWEFSGNQYGDKPFPPPDGKWTVETNIFAQGQMWDGTATYKKDAYNPATQFHTYSVEWDEDHIDWYIDNQVVRSFQASDTPSGYNFPQSPMKLQLGVWGGGDPANNYWTIQWAGGEIDMKGAPYTMYVRSVNITNKYPACEYKYKDRSGKITAVDKIQEGCRASSAVNSVVPRIVKNTPSAEASTPLEPIGKYPTAIISESTSSSGAVAPSPSSSSPIPSEDDSVTGQPTSASSTTSPAASSGPIPPPDTDGYPIRSSSSGGYQLSSSSPGPSGYPTSSPAAGGYPVPPSSNTGSYPVGSTSSGGGILSSLSSLIMGTSSGVLPTDVLSAQSNVGTYPATSIPASGSPSISSSIAPSSGVDSSPGASGSSSVGTPTPIATPYPTESPTVGSSVGGIASSIISTDTISTVYSTNIYTVTSCAATVQNCPVGQITTELVSLSTTKYPVTKIHSSSSMTLSTFESDSSTPLVSSSTPMGSSPSLETGGQLSSSFMPSLSSTLETGVSSAASYPVSSRSLASPALSNPLATGSALSTGISLPVYVSSGLYPNTTVPTDQSIPAATQSPSGSVTQSPSTPIKLTISTVYSTNIYTITSCAPTVTNCPAQLGQVTTELISLYTTICPVGQDGTTSPKGSSYPLVSTSASSVSSGASFTSLSSSVSAPVLTTSTVYTSSIYTVSSCAQGAVECFSQIGSITTELVPLYTTVCPIEDVSTTSSSPTTPTVNKSSTGKASSAISEASSSPIELISPSPSLTPSKIPVYTTSTVYSTNIYTVTSCASGVVNCPGVGAITTEVVAVSTTVCPVSDKTVPAGVTSVLQSGGDHTTAEVTISNTFGGSVVVITSIITFVDTLAPYNPTGDLSTATTAGTVAESVSSGIDTKTTQPCTTLTLGSYFTTVITYASLTQRPPASVSSGPLMTSYYTHSSTPVSDVPSYIMTDVTSTVEMGPPSSTAINATSVVPTRGGQGGKPSQCACESTVSTVYATITMTVAETTVTSTVTMEPPFPSSYRTGAGAAPLGTGVGGYPTSPGSTPVGTRAAIRRWFGRNPAGHGHGHHY